LPKSYNRGLGVVMALVIGLAALVLAAHLLIS
jgi:hypothetical protein